MTARHDDPATSHAAISEPDKRGVETAIMWALRVWAQPMTAGQVHAVLDREGEDRAPGTVATALSRLVKAGRVRVADQAGVTDRGRRCSRYEAIR